MNAILDVSVYCLPDCLKRFSMPPQTPKAAGGLPDAWMQPEGRGPGKSNRQQLRFDLRSIPKHAQTTMNSLSRRSRPRKAAVLIVTETRFNRIEDATNAR